MGGESASKREFYGDRRDLEEFLRLVASPMRSERRDTALREWDKYKEARQTDYVSTSGIVVGGKRIRHDPGKKDAGIVLRSIAPAIDLRGGDFQDICLGYADLRGVRFDDANFAPDERAWAALKGAQLAHASLRNVQMPGMRLMDADLSHADLSNANLVDADLGNANLRGANLHGAQLDRANLEGANLVGANVEGASLDGARVYGVAAWDLQGRTKSSLDLIVTQKDSTAITVDDIRVAQVIHMFLNNPEIRDVLDTLTRKVVLLLGRFTPERIAVLKALQDALRSLDLVPVLFNFKKQEERGVTETVTLVARMARFVIADLTDPASIPHELASFVPDVEVPVRLIIAEGHTPYSMSSDFRKYHWVLRPYRYGSKDELIENLQTRVIDVAEAKRLEIQRARETEAW